LPASVPASSATAASSPSIGATRRQPEAARQGVAPDPGDHRLARPVELAEQFGELAPALVGGEDAAVAAAHALEVGAGAERPVPRAGEDAHPDLEVVPGPGERRPEIGHQGPR
jgi:hypothetical protein